MPRTRSGTTAKKKKDTSSSSSSAPSSSSSASRASKPPRKPPAAKPTAPSDELRVQKLVNSAFSDAQRTTAVHDRASKQLLDAYRASQQHFYVSFFYALNRILIIFSRDPPVERLIVFVAKFCATHSESMSNFCPHLLEYLSSHSVCATSSVRFRTLQLIATILKFLPQDVDVALDTVEQCVVNRVTDKIPRVRAAAANALCRLQTSGELDDDECTSLLADMVASDASASVRKAAVYSIAPTESVVPTLMARIFDVNAPVRKSVYETFAFKIHPSLLSQDDISTLLKNGLTDRNDTVRNACSKQMLIQGWMKGVCNGNLFQFVDIIGCDDHELEVLNALRIIFESPEYSSLVNLTKIDINNLTKDSVLILRGLSEARRTDGGLDKFIPNLVAYSDALKYYAVDHFATKHLLELCKCIDMSDEAGRKSLEHTLVHSFIVSKDIPEDIIPITVRALKRTMVDVEQCPRLLLETIQIHIMDDDDVGNDPDGEQADLEDMHANHMENEAQGNEGRRSSTFENENGKDEELTYWQVLRSLTITHEVFKSATLRSSSSPTYPVFVNLFHKCVSPNLMNVDNELRLKALECLGLFCMLDSHGEEAKMKMPIFLQACKSDVPEIQELTLKIISDLLMLYDFSNSDSRPPVNGDEQDHTRNGSGETPNEDDDDADGEDETEKTDDEARSAVDTRDESSPPKAKPISEECLDLLVSLINSEADPQMRTSSALGLARLLHIRKIVCNATILYKLIILYFDPETEEDSQLRQSLTIFFPVFSAQLPTNRLCLEDVFYKVLAEFKRGSTSSSLPLPDVMHYIIELTASVVSSEASQDKKKREGGQEDAKSSDEEIHERLADQVLNDIIDANNGDNITDARALAKVLTGFKLPWSPSSDVQLGMIFKLVQTAIEEASDRQLLRSLSSFSNRVYEELEKRVEYEKEQKEQSEIASEGVENDQHPGDDVEENDVEEGDGRETEVQEEAATESEVQEEAATESEVQEDEFQEDEDEDESIPAQRSKRSKQRKVPDRRKRNETGDEPNDVKSSSSTSTEKRGTRHSRRRAVKKEKAVGRSSGNSNKANDGDASVEVIEILD